MTPWWPYLGDSDRSLRYCFSLKSKLLIDQGNGVASSIYLSTNSPRIKGVPGKLFIVKAFFADSYLLGVLVSLKKHKFITM